MFTQPLNLFGNLVITMLVALVPIIVVLGLLAGLRLSAWINAIISSIIIFLVALLWGVPGDNLFHAYVYGLATGFWAIDWIVI